MYQRRITQILVRHCQVGGKIDFRGVLRWNSISCIWYLGYCRGRPGIMDCWFEVMWGDSEGEIWILIWQFFQIHQSYNARQKSISLVLSMTFFWKKEKSRVCANSHIENQEQKSRFYTFLLLWWSNVRTLFSRFLVRPIWVYYIPFPWSRYGHVPKLRNLLQAMFHTLLRWGLEHVGIYDNTRGKLD